MSSTKHVLLIALIILSGCSSQETTSSKSNTVSSMKCGAGKCGANMFDGNSALEKKKKNMLTQMSAKDSRRTCVIEAPSSKKVYDCVRDFNTKRLTTKCGTKTKSNTTMKCAAGKCGSGM
jgi:hypothetical protein